MHQDDVARLDACHDLAHDLRGGPVSGVPGVDGPEDPRQSQACANSTASSDRFPNGGRNRVTGPAAAATTLAPRSTSTLIPSRRARADSVRVRVGADVVALGSESPDNFRMRSTSVPTTKKVARASAAARISSRPGVLAGEGPSSYVSATRRSRTPPAARTAPTPGPRRASNLNRHWLAGMGRGAPGIGCCSRHRRADHRSDRSRCMCHLRQPTRRGRQRTLTERGFSPRLVLLSRCR